MHLGLIEGHANFHAETPYKSSACMTIQFEVLMTLSSFKHVTCYCPFLFQGALLSRMANLGIQDDLNSRTRGSKVVALGCKMVGGGTDGSLDLCARVCLIDEYENIIFHTYVKPQIPVTNYRFDESL